MGAFLDGLVFSERRWQMRKRLIVPKQPVIPLIGVLLVSAGPFDNYCFHRADNL